MRGPDRESSRAVHPLLALTWARVLEFWREPEAVFWVYVFPLIMMVSLGLAFRNRPVERVAVDVQQSAVAPEIAAALETDERFSVQICEPADCRRRLRIGKSDLLVASQPDSADGYLYVYDPTKPNGVLARGLADDVLQRAAGRKNAVPIREREYVEPGGRYIDFLVPGLVGLGLMGGGLWGVGFSIVDLRIRKLLKRFLATPMRRNHFLAAVMISRLLFAIPEVFMLLLIARLGLGVMNFGSYALLMLVILLGALQFCGIGLLVAARPQKLETVSGLMNLVMLPMWIGSGVFFSVDRFPEAVQPWLKALPLTPLIDALRAVMLEGVGIAAIGLELLIIIAWTVIPFLLALRWFRWS